MQFDLTAKTIYLRLLTEDDAEFVCQLRGDDKLNTFISKTDVDIEVQRQWIKNYKSREQNKKEYYFIICRVDDNRPVGTVRLYDFKEEPKSFCWGSWILNNNKTKYAAVESALLVYEMGFDKLGFDQSHFDVMKGNQSVHDFHLRMGAQQVSEDEQNIYYVFPKQRYEINKEKYAKFLN
ncbi:GNAT family N-acetyltransferase [Psychrobacter lutiphocae]|uniref:GNAT family N-acetyltransferase n=1 Tax=Psychrobacter lutiphocae TaxID=540500 RepID=UPI00036482A2|nr:GNAT family N-acetyltransferase [Psychrobacter lutiphocae]